jgi:AAA ATPase domain
VELVGRPRELAAIDALLDRPADEGGALVAFVGPAGSGKTALASAAVARARSRGVPVLRASRVGGSSDGLVWAQLIRAAGAPDRLAAGLLTAPSSLDLDSVAQVLITAERRLVVVDDVRSDGIDRDLLSAMAGRLAAGRTAVLVTATTPLGLGDDIALGPLSEADLAGAMSHLGPEAVHAIWVASRGNPGAATVLVREITDLDAAPDPLDPLVHLALSATSTTRFLTVDWAMVRWLDEALTHRMDDGSRVRLLAKLAAELLGDPTSTARRRELVDSALSLARESGQSQPLAVALDARLQALWDPDGADDRLAAASEIVDLATATHDDVRLRQGLFWRFVALMELGRVGEAESALAAFTFAATAAGDAADRLMAVARHAMLATMRGRFEEAERLVADVAEAGRRIDLPDLDALLGTLRGALVFSRGQVPAQADADAIFAAARESPGHLHEATGALVLALRGDLAGARSELDRTLPAAWHESGPRWLAAVLDLAEVAVLVEDRAAAARLYETLRPYDGRLAVLGGANTCRGPVAHGLGVLALLLGDTDASIGHLRDAAALAERIGALPFLAVSSAELATALRRRDGPGDAAAAAELLARAADLADRLGLTGRLAPVAPGPDEWSLQRDGDDWLLHAGAEDVRLRDSRGLHYLRDLLAAGGQEVPALDLVAGGAGLAERPMGAVLDGAAYAAYRARLAALSGELDAADAAGDQSRAAGLEEERQDLLGELRRATGLAGRVRETSPEAERARVNATRSIRAAIDRIAQVAPMAAAHLTASVRTGGACRYDAAPGGPRRWRV